MDSKVLLIFWIIGVAAAGLIFWRMLSQEGKPVTLPKKEGDIIFFGDSLVEGIGAGPDMDLPSQLSRRLGVEIINAGKSGDTTASALNRLERDVLLKDPRLVIILLGGNDILQRSPPEEVAKNLRKIIELIRKEDAGIILIGVRGGIFGDPYKEMFENLAKERGVVYYVPDILDGIIGNPDLMSDPVHPNNQGYAKIADKLEPVLRKLLR